jgi:hypothetical protein
MVTRYAEMASSPLRQPPMLPEPAPSISNPDAARSRTTWANDSAEQANCTVALADASLQTSDLPSDCDPSLRQTQSDDPNCRNALTCGNGHSETASDETAVHGVKQVAADELAGTHPPAGDRRPRALVRSRPGFSPERAPDLFLPG